MHSLHHPHHADLAERDQLDLFRPPPSESPGSASWERLPAEARRTLTSLMARLMMEHDGARHPETKGGRHDL